MDLRPASVDDDGEKVFGRHLVDEAVHACFQQAQLVLIPHRSRDVNEEDEVGILQLTLRNILSLNTNPDQLVRYVPKTGANLSVQINRMLTATDEGII